MDEHFKEFLCPLGKKVVDFCDEPQFGQATTYLKGRDWLDDKAKVAEIAGDLHPETFVIKNGQWEGKQPPADEDARQAPWFIKEADKNWGNSIVICAKPSEIMGHINSESSYVVQQHVPDPRCMDDGRKCHVKFYILLWCAEDGVSWELFTYKSAFLSISPTKWSADDLSTETQVTIVRHHEGLGTPEEPAAIGWADWAEVYPKFKHAVAKIIRQAVEEGKLEGRVGKRQFELFSADLMMDTHGAPWLFEFNMSPAICQHGFALQHDEKMMRDALSIVIPWEGGSGPGLWDAAGQFTGQTPALETIRWAVEEGGPVQRTA